MSMRKNIRRELARLEADPNVMSTADAAAALDLSPKQLWRLIEKGKIGRPACPTPRRCFVARVDVEGVLQAMGQAALTDTTGYNISRKETARYLGVCVETVSRMVKDGRLSEPVVKSGRCYFRACDIVALQRKRLYETPWGIREIQEYTDLTDRQLILLRRTKLPAPVRAWIWHRGDITTWWESVNGDPASAYPELARSLAWAANY